MSLNLAMTSLNHVPALLRKISWKKGQVNLDLGGGKFEKATNYLYELGVNNIVLDKYARDRKDNFLAESYLDLYGCDSVTISNVLCVVRTKRERLNILYAAKRYVRTGGSIYISIYAGDGSGKGKRTKSNTWQNNRPLRTYLNEIREVFPNAELKSGYIMATQGE